MAVGAMTARWAVRVDGVCLIDFATAGDRSALERLRRGATCAAPAVWRYPLLLHVQSVADLAPLPTARQTLSPQAREIAAALADSDGGAESLFRAWNGLLRRRAGRVGHRFDLYADYLASAREFLLTSLLAVPSTLPPSDARPEQTARFLDSLAGGVRHGAMKYADRELYRLTKQMVREGVLTWRDERGRVQEHPCLRTTVDDPAPLVAERELRRELKTFVVRFGPRLLGRRNWERFRLHCFEGWTQAAIAAEHGVSQQAVSESLATAAVRLRQAFLAHRASRHQPGSGA